jgi:hypothetical protein
LFGDGAVNQISCEICVDLTARSDERGEWEGLEASGLEGLAWWFEEVSRRGYLGADC